MAGVKGRSGKKLDSILHDALMVALRLEEDDDRRGKTNAERIVIKAISKAKEGDVSAIREIWDRAEGKAQQPITADIDGSIAVRWASEKS